MSYENYTTGQKVLAAAIASKGAHTECTADEFLEVLSDTIGYIVAHFALSKSEMTEYIDDILLPNLHLASIAFFDKKITRYED